MDYLSTDGRARTCENDREKFCTIVVKNFVREWEQCAFLPFNRIKIIYPLGGFPPFLFLFSFLLFGFSYFLWFVLNYEITCEQSEYFNLGNAQHLQRTVYRIEFHFQITTDKRSRNCDAKVRRRWRWIRCFQRSTGSNTHRILISSIERYDIRTLISFHLFRKDIIRGLRRHCNICRCIQQRFSSFSYRVCDNCAKNFARISPLPLLTSSPCRISVASKEPNLHRAEAFDSRAQTFGRVVSKEQPATLFLLLFFS